MLVHAYSTLARSRYVAALIALAVVGVGCPGEPTKPSVDAPARVASFGVDRGVVKTGESVRFSWETENASVATLSFNGEPLHQAEGDAAKSGAFEATVSRGGTFVLEATGPGGRSPQARIVVRIQDAPSIAEFVAVPAEVISGEQTTLRWKSSGGTRLRLATTDGKTVLEETDEVNIAEGSERVVVATPTEYVLSISNEAGTHTQAVSVSILPPAKLTQFTAEPNIINVGETAALAWTTVDATDLSLTANGVAVPLAPGATSLQVSPAVTTEYTFTAIGAGGNAQSTRTVTVRVPPSVTHFAVEPTSIELGTQTATISWTTAEANTVELRETFGGNSTTVDLRGAGVNGSVTVAPSAAGQYRYQLVASGPGGDATSQERTLTVIDPAVVIEDFAASASSITRGEPVTLTWSTRNASSIRIESTSPSLGTEVVATSGDVAGEVTVVPSVAETFVFTLTAIHADESEVSESVTVQVIAPEPRILDFDSSVSGLTVPGNFELSWTTTDATSVSITQNDGTTTTTLLAAGQPSGTLSVPVSAVGTYSYVLTATGPTAPDAISAPVVVTSATTAPEITSFTVPPGPVDLGTEHSLSWTATDAASYRVTANDEVIYEGAGLATTHTPGAAGTIVYRLTAIGAGGVDQDPAFDRTVVVTPDPAIVAFSASAATLSIGDSVTLSWETTNATSVAISDGTQSIDLGAASPEQGSVMLTLTQSGSYTFTLVAQRSGVPDATESVEVTVNAPAPAFSSFDVQPRIVTLGNPVQLSWATSDADAVFLTPWAPTPALPLSSARGQGFEDIRASGQAVRDASGNPLTGDEAMGTLTFPGGFSFPFFGEAKTSAKVSANGVLGFAASYQGLSNNVDLGSAGAPLELIAPFWDDLKLFAGTSALVYELRDATLPTERLIIQWDRVGLYKAGETPSDVLTFQVALFRSGDVAFRYGPRSGGRVSELSGSSATIGVKGRAAGLFFQESHATANQVSPDLDLRIGQRFGGPVGSGAPLLLAETAFVSLTAVAFNGSTRAAPIQIQVVAAPVIATFEGDRERVGSGDPIVLRWETTSATEWKLFADGVELTGVPQVANGTWTLNPLANTRYRLVALNAAGDAEERVLDVIVDQPLINGFSADEAIKPLGAPVELAWSTAGARSLILSQGSTTLLELNDPADRERIRLGTLSHVPPAGAAVTYTLTLENGSGVATQDVTIEATSAPRVVSFRSGANRVTTGDPLALTWKTANAARVIIREHSSQPAPTTEYDTTAPAELVSFTISRTAPQIPSAQLPETGPVTYSAQVQASDGSLSPEIFLDVTVLARPSFVSTDYSPKPAIVGQPATISWSTIDAEVVRIRDADTGVYLLQQAPPSGSTELTFLQSPANLVLEAVNEFGHGTPETLSFPLTVPPPALTVSIGKMMVARQDPQFSDPVTLSWDAQNVPNVRMIPPQPRASTATFFDLSNPNVIDPALVTNITPAIVDNAMSAVVQLPADFRPTFLGRDVTAFRANTNGYVTFEETATTTTGYSASNFPTTVLPPLTLAAFLDDLKGDGPGAAMLTAIVGSGSDQKLIVQWSRWSFFFSTTVAEGSSLNFQIQLSAEGEIDIVYGENVCGSTACINTNRHLGTQAMIGVSHLPNINERSHQQFGTVAAYREARPDPLGNGSGAIGLSELLPPSGSLSLRMAPYGTATATTVLSRYFLFSATNDNGTVERDAPLTVLDSDELMITELMIDPAGADEGKEWIEVRSDAIRPIDLRGLTLTAGGNSVTLGGHVPVPLYARSNSAGLPFFAAVGQSADSAVNGGFELPLGYGSAGQGGLSFDNDADTIELQAGPIVFDSLHYDRNKGGDEAWPVVEGRSMALSSSQIRDTTNVAGQRLTGLNDLPYLWCKSAGGLGRDQPTPGAENGECYYFEATDTTGTTLGYVPISTLVADAIAAGEPAVLTGDVTGATSTQSVRLPIGFPFWFFGQWHEQLQVARHGYVTFIENTSAPSATSITSLEFPTAFVTTATAMYRREMIAPFWQGLNRRTSGSPTVRVARIGASPNQRFIVEWIDHKSITSGAETDVIQVQLRLHEDGTIQFAYGDLIGARARLEHGSVGLGAIVGQFGASYLFNSTTSLGANGLLDPWHLVTLRKVQ